MPGASVAIVRAGSIARLEVAGYANARTKELVRIDTPFEVASIGKPILAIALMQLVEKKRLSLEDDAQIRNPKFPNDVITLRMLLQHTSSVHDPDLRSFAGDPPLADFVRDHLEWTSNTPGTKVEYSNLGFCVLAIAIERASGERFSEYVHAHVLEPSGVKHAGYRIEGASPHRGTEPLPNVFHAVYPVIDLRASSLDIARVIAALVHGDLLGPEATREMISDRLGWQSIDLAGKKFLGHEGEDDGASTFLVVDFDARDAAVVLTNGDAFRDPKRAKAIEEIVVRSISAGK